MRADVREIDGVEGDAAGLGAAVVTGDAGLVHDLPLRGDRPSSAPAVATTRRGRAVAIRRRYFAWLPRARRPRAAARFGGSWLLGLAAIKRGRSQRNDGDDGHPAHH